MPLNEDAECAARQIVRHVCLAYKRYLEAHLYSKVEQLRRSQMRPSDRYSQPPATLPSYKVSRTVFLDFTCLVKCCINLQACKSSAEEVQQQIETLLQCMPFRGHWAPVDQLIKLGGIMLLLKIIAFAYEWNYSGRYNPVHNN